MLLPDLRAVLAEPVLRRHSVPQPGAVGVRGRVAELAEHHQRVVPGAVAHGADAFRVRILVHRAAPIALRMVYLHKQPAQHVRGVPRRIQSALAWRIWTGDRNSTQYGATNGKKNAGIRSHGHDISTTETPRTRGIRLDVIRFRALIKRLFTWLRSGTVTTRSSGNRPGTGGRRMVRKRALQKGQRDSMRPQAKMQTKQK